MRAGKEDMGESEGKKERRRRGEREKGRGNTLDSALPYR